MAVSIGGDDKNQDVEINIASIIDCLVVLIAYTLISASFLSIGILEASVVPPGAQADPAVKPEARITLDIKRSNAIQVGISSPEGTMVESSEIVATDKGEPDLETLEAKLEVLRGKFGGLTSAVMTADQAVQYKRIVATIERTRKTLPNIILGERNEK